MKTFFPNTPIFSAVDDKKPLCVYAVYVDNEAKSRVYTYRFSGPKTDVERNFKKELKIFIERHEARTFTDFLFFVSLASPFSSYTVDLTVYNPTVEMLSNYSFEQDPVVEGILKDTRGLLLWNYQLDNLLGLFSDHSKWIRRMAKGINTRDSRVENKVRQLKINNKASLLDLINERMVMGFTNEPPTRGAYILFKTLSGEI
jgi:hypothetical protein